MQKQIYLKVYGCQMNEYDADLIRELLSSQGYRFIDQEDDADIVLLQTCSVRDLAEVKVFNKISKLIARKKKKQNGLVIGICGCMAKNQSERILKKYPAVDLLCGPSSYTDLPQLLKEAENYKKMRTSVNIDKRDSYPQLSTINPKLLSSVAIMRGCDNYCTYCIVPYVRGRETSRPSEEIISEVKTLLNNGAKDITLLGQNVNSYKSNDNYTFVELLQDLNNIDHKYRIRFLTSHPKDASEQLFQAMADLDKVCPYLHLPIQSGSDEILKKMNRKYTVSQYMDKINLVKKIIPKIGLSSDFILGFPGETEEDFRKTYEIIERVGYDFSYIFKYSTRTGTKAADLPDDVPRKVKEGRHYILLELQKKVGLEKNNPYIGKTVAVLVEGISKRNSERLNGRTSTFKNVVFEGTPDLVGKFVNIKIEKTTPFTLIGNIDNG